MGAPVNYGTCARAASPAVMPICIARRCAVAFVNLLELPDLGSAALHTLFVNSTLIHYIIQ